MVLWLHENHYQVHLQINKYVVINCFGMKAKILEVAYV